MTRERIRDLGRGRSNQIKLANTIKWLDAIYSRCSADDGELIFVSACKRKVEVACRLGSRDALVAAAKAVNGKPGLYLKINPMDADAMRERSKRENKGRYITGTIDEVKTVVSFHLDCDAGKGPRYLSRVEMLRALDEMPHKPTLIVNSCGDTGGFHAYWLLDRPHRIVDKNDCVGIVEAAKRWQDELRRLTTQKVDRTANIDRVLRVVGGRRTDGHRVTCHSYHPERLYTPEDLWLPKPSPKLKRRGLRRSARTGFTTAEEFAANTDRIAIEGQEGSNACFYVACRLLDDYALSEDEALRVLRDKYNPRCQPEWSERELKHKVSSALRKIDHEDV